MINRARSRTRARGEHAFRIVKQLWGFAKVGYRGPAKNLARAQTMFALANLYRFRRELLPTETEIRDEFGFHQRGTTDYNASNQNL
jgi:IS5 family transposase